jgi:cell wall-associated NlpC family hydrolase
MPLLLLVLLTLIATPVTAAPLPGYAVATVPAPVLNLPDLPAAFGGREGRPPTLDDCGQLRALEFVALPGTVFTVHDTLQRGDATILQVTTADYPYPAPRGLYLDARAVRMTGEKPTERPRRLPDRETVLSSLRRRTGAPYVWGGNLGDGLPHLLTWYPATAPLTDRERQRRQMTGVDCSGLLYEATGGYTPRNTSSLVTYGRAVRIAGSTAADLARRLEPLDLIVWPGHVLIVLDGGEVIESRLVCSTPDRGVRIRPLQAALADIMATRQPVDRIGKSQREFVVRRWYGTR